MLRRPLSLTLLALTALAPSASFAQGLQPIPASGEVRERSHQIELSIEREGARVLVERTFANPGASPVQIDLPIALPCAATLDRVRLRAADGSGWLEAPVLAADEAEQRWDMWLERSPSVDADAMRDPDTALHVTRGAYSCEASLSLFPLPPFGERTVSYRVWLPSSYDEGAYHITVPRFADYGLAASASLERGQLDPAFTLQVDGTSMSGSAPLPLDGLREHQLVLRPEDPTRAQVEAASFDLPGLLAAHPDARAALSPEELAGELPHLLHARFDVPAQLDALPPVRRVVLLLDSSRSFEGEARDAAERAALAYLEALAARARARDPFGRSEPRVEVINFARELEPLYHDFVPLSWAREDLDAVEVELQNGSALDLALARARELLSQAARSDPAPVEGADWILVFSDLDLRRAFDLEAEARRLGPGGPRVHVVDIHEGHGFEPGALDQPWTALAQRSGGMAWALGDQRWGLEDFGPELVEPQRIWNLHLDARLAGGGRERLLEGQTLALGQRYHELHELPDAAEHIEFGGEVWGRARSWSAPTDLAVARREAGRIAGDSDYASVSDAVATALAHFAEAVTPYTSAYLEQAGEGALFRPSTGFGYIGSLGCRGGYSTSCGGGRGVHLSTSPRPSVAELAQAALDACPRARSGELTLETTAREIVDVFSQDACVGEQAWGLDLRPAVLLGHQVIRLEYVAGQIASTEQQPA